MSLIEHSREDKRRWTLAGDSKAEVTSGPPIVRGIEVRVIPEAEADRQHAGAVDAIRAARDAARTPGDVKIVRAILNEALDRFDRHPYAWAWLDDLRRGQ